MDELIGNMDDLYIDGDEEEIQLSKELENGNINPAYRGSLYRPNMHLRKMGFHRKIH